MLDQGQLARKWYILCRSTDDETDDVVSSDTSGTAIRRHTAIMTPTPDIRPFSEEDPPGREVRQHRQRYRAGRPVSKSLLNVMANSLTLLGQSRVTDLGGGVPVMNVMQGAAEGKVRKEEAAL